MEKGYVYYEYVLSEGVKLFTTIVLPYKGGKFPVVLHRNPYVDLYEEMPIDEMLTSICDGCTSWLDKGYALVFQHCRGRGKSEGDCIPYINERKDGLAFLEWIRNQDFYNGEIYLRGGSYTTSVHYTVAPYAEDIKGAVFGAQDSERYNIMYRNGCFKKGLHGNWYVNMYKKKSHMKKNFYYNESFDTLPLKDFTGIVFGEPSKDFDEALKSPKREDEFWSTHMGGADARDATKNVDFPVLFTTAFNDIYTGGIFDMWNNMSEKSRKTSALVVTPYNHGDNYDQGDTIIFPNGRKVERFGEEYDLEWFEYVRGKTEKSPFEQNKITYYRLFENVWKTEKDFSAENKMEITIGDDTASYVYNPYAPPKFEGGLSTTFGGAVYQKPNDRADVISVYTEPFEKEVFVKGKMTAKLKVKSDCEDTCFYVRISIEKEEGDFGLRDDITTLCHQLGDYTPNSEVVLDFTFDEHAFLIKKGERLRIDIASANNNAYVRHTNNKGLFSEQTTAKIANNTVYLKDSTLILPIE